MTRAGTKNILIYFIFLISQKLPIFKLKFIFNIGQRALDFDHPIKLKNIKLVNKSSKYEIKIVESILIHKLSPNLNDLGSSFPL